MTEFTGERVIPGQVNDDLWAEHVARYAFAARLTAGKRVLDAGCGTGYGTAELAARARSTVGIDVAFEAVQGARGAQYAQASVTAMPFRSGTFDLVVAFEVIEHLADWRTLLSEARRVLAPGGLFLVSTPNRLYYAESRETEGPNPYHVHEFDYEEFRIALAEFFPVSRILLQNRLEAFAFHSEAPAGAVEARLDRSQSAPEEAHFFIGVCGMEACPGASPFVYVPRAANVLREREQHIRKLEQELKQTKQWLERQIADHSKLQGLHEELTEHLQEKNRWALELEAISKAAQERIVQLQEEFRVHQAEANAMAEGYAAQVAELDRENRAKTEWALETEARLTGELAARAEQLAATVRLLDQAEATVVERTQWAQRLDAELGMLRAQLGMVRESRWVKLGRAVGMGPKL